MIARLAGGIVVAATALLVTASPAAAHGVGGRTDLPLPLWMFAYGAGAVVVASFLALRVLWPGPRLRAAAEGRVVAAGLFGAARRPLFVAARAVGLAAFALTLASAWLGSENPAANFAPAAVYIAFWIGLPVASLLLGDVWWALNPFDTLARLGQAVRRRLNPRDGRARAEAGPIGPTWPAAAMLAIFVWLELAYHDPGSPPVLAVWLTIHTIVALAGAARWGRGWLRYGEGFAALFSLIGRMAPLHVLDGRLRVRAPFAGLATTPIASGLGPVILVVLGSTTFDGATRSDLWLDVAGGRTGWSQTAVSSVGLAFAIGVMAVAYLAAVEVAARVVDRPAPELGRMFLPSLVPILLAYTLAHYFSLLVLEGQDLFALLSDPLGRGWDLFGTAGWRVDYTLVSVDTIAYVQLVSIVVGHVVGVAAAHDRAIEEFPPSRVQLSQYPLLGVMVLFTVGGLALMLGG